MGVLSGPLSQGDIRSEFSQIPAQSFDAARKNPGEHGQRLKSFIGSRDVLRDCCIFNGHSVFVFKGIAFVGGTE